MTASSEKKILARGRNCWRILPASRAAFLVDADAYFTAFADAVTRAQKSILIVGWDMDSRTRLRCHAEDDMPAQFGEFLNAIVARRRGLHVHLLTWNFAFIYALEREALPTIKLGWRTHRRIHFRLDGAHPPGASHHQKVVVIDDRLAFVGGLDFAIRRWDTPQHAAHNSYRVDPGGKAYPPFHDVQMMVEGPVAGALGDLLRERWFRATGERLERPRTQSIDPWPKGVRPDAENVEVAVARTDPGFGNGARVIEVKRLWLDAIANAKHYIFIENQYFTSSAIAGALATRLQERDGPEVLVILPRYTEGWLEESVMGVLRKKLIKRLREADRFGRLRMYYPHVPGIESGSFMVHSKVLVVDDRLLRIGSSNTSNRSMGLDTECDLALESDKDARVAGIIARFRCRLLGEHLGVDADAVAARHRDAGSLIHTVESLRRRNERTLEELNDVTPAVPLDVLPDAADFDPEEPIEPQKLLDKYVPEEVRTRARFRSVRIVLVVLLLLALAAAWQFTPLRESFDLDTLSNWIAVARDYPATPVIMLGLFVLGGLVIFPVTLLIAGTALTFGPLAGFLYSLIGCLTSATLVYFIGKWLGQETVYRFTGSRLHKLGRKLVRRGLITIVTMRLVPVAPFSVTNLVAGAFRIRLRDLLLGTIIGMTPGILAITALMNSLTLTLERPRPQGVAVFVMLSLVVAGSAVAVRRWLGRDKNDRKSGRLQSTEPDR